MERNPGRHAGDAERDGIRVHERLTIPRRELTFEAARSGGPGGQNVNRTASKVVLRFDVAGSPTLGDWQRARIRERLANRINGRGELVLHASKHRERLQNERDACERLAELLREALRQKKARRKTRPTKGSVRRRLANKERRSRLKRDRGRVDE